MSLLPAPSSLTHRMLSAVCAALVLALVMLGASPAAHQWLHASDAAHACAKHAAKAPAPGVEHDCAIVLFAHGVENSTGQITAGLPRIRAERIAFLASAELHLASPRFLLPPERGPPASQEI